MITADLLAHILGQLEEVRVRCPELRFGQLIATIGMLAEDETGHSLWDVEDADFAKALERFAADMARRVSSSAEPQSGRSGKGGVQVFERTMDNPEDQDDLNRQLHKPGEPKNSSSALLGRKVQDEKRAKRGQKKGS